MKIIDLKEGMIITYSTKGEGIILKVTKRTVTTKFKYSTSKITLKSNDTNIDFSDL